MTDLIEDTRREITTRLRELKPLVDEYERIAAAVAALDGLPGTASAAPSPVANGTAPAARRRGKAGAAAAVSRPRGRPKGSGTRAQESIALIKASPGITTAQIAAKMGIGQNYLHRVLPRLAKDGVITKDGRGWHLAAGE